MRHARTSPPPLPRLRADMEEQLAAHQLGVEVGEIINLVINRIVQRLRAYLFWGAAFGTFSFFGTVFMLFAWGLKW